MDTNYALFEEKNILKMFFKIAILGSIGMLASAIYQLIDGILVNIFLGSQAFSAINLAFPFIILLYAISDMIGVGSSVIIAIKLGQKKQEEANSIFTSSLILIFIVNFIIGAIVSIFSKNLLSLMGAKGQLLELANQYLLVYTLTLPLSSYIFAVDNYLRISGHIKMSMIVNISMSIFIVLLELFILGVIKTSTWGSAFASCLGFIIFTIVSFIPFFKKTSKLKFSKPNFDFSLLITIAKNGGATFFSNIAARLTAIVFNFVLLSKGGEDAVSSYGVLMYIDGFIQPLLYGMNDALQPCIGYNYGANQIKRVKKIVELCFLSSFILCLIGFVALISFPQISLIFTSSGSTNLQDMAKLATIIFSFTYLTRWISFSSQGFFSAIEKPLASIIISLGISIVFPMICLPLYLVLDLNGIWINFPISSLLTGIVCLILLFIYIKKKKVLAFKQDISLTN